nr:hypothetical protein Itr_chr04CG23350 [Ipomoea trifida]
MDSANIYSAQEDRISFGGSYFDTVDVAIRISISGDVWHRKKKFQVHFIFKLFNTFLLIVALVCLCFLPLHNF